MMRVLSSQHAHEQDASAIPLPWNDSLATSGPGRRLKIGQCHFSLSFFLCVAAQRCVCA